MLGAIIIHCLATISVRMGDKKELGGGCQGRFRVRDFGAIFLPKIVVNFPIRLKERGHSLAVMSIEPLTVEIDNRHQKI